MDNNFLNTADFLKAVAALRVLCPRHIQLAAYAAQYWLDGEFLAKVDAVDITATPSHETVQ